MSDAFTTSGACSWIELITTDAKASGEFYSKLFDWAVEKMPMADGKEYNLIKLGENGIGGIVEMPDMSPGMGGWGVYITVADVDATVKLAESLGGKTMVPAFDAPGVGRIAKLVDGIGCGISVITYSSEG